MKGKSKENRFAPLALIGEVSTERRNRIVAGVWWARNDEWNEERRRAQPL